MHLVFTLNDIYPAVEKLWKAYGKYNVWAFHGEMGTGKTTLIHTLCEMLGVTSAIGSPTYSIINEYHSPAKGIIYHLDLYRLRDEEEAMQAGVEDVLYSGNIAFVEWPEKAPGLIPGNCLHVHLTLVDEQTRQVFVNEPLNEVV